MNEKLSAFMDNELSEKEREAFLRQLTADPQLRGAWGRYHVIRAAIRNELDPLISPGLAARVAVEIEKAPVVLVPQGPAAIDRRSFAKFAASLAIAASVAVMAIGAMQWFRAGDGPAAVQTAGNAVSRDAYIHAGAIRWDTNTPEHENALNAYLVEHNEFTPTSGVGGVMSYVRVVGYDRQR